MGTGGLCFGRPVAHCHNGSVKAVDATIPSASVFENEGDGFVQQIVKLEISSLSKPGKGILPPFRACLLHSNRIGHFPNLGPPPQNFADPLQFFNHSVHNLSVSLLKYLTLLALFATISMNLETRAQGHTVFLDAG
jgi:hypothetical protein